MGSQNIAYQILASPKTVFSLQDAGLMYSGKEKLSAALNYYVDKGLLANPRRGIYAKRGYRKEELACAIYTPSYISLQYVLLSEGIIFQYDSAITLVSSLSREVAVDGQCYRFHKIKGEILASPEGIVLGDGAPKASAERAFLDTLYLYPSFYFDNLSSLDFDKVFRILPIYNNKALERRVKTLLTNGQEQA